MPKFSNRSKRKLNTCDYRLRIIFNEVVKKFDCSVICGHRNKQDQNEAFYSRKSKLKYPRSKHNSKPSRAVDVCPYPINWRDTGKFYIFAGYVLRVADELSFKIRFGGDWDGDKETKDQSFNDLPHFEIMD